jgi:hypothetical protein
MVGMVMAKAAAAARALLARPLIRRLRLIIVDISVLVVAAQAVAAGKPEVTMDPAVMGLVVAVARGLALVLCI